MLITLLNYSTMCSCPVRNLRILILKSAVRIKQSVISVAFKTPLKNNIGNLYLQKFTSASTWWPYWFHTWAQLGGGHEERAPQFFRQWGYNMPYPHIFLFRFRKILVSRQVVPHTFYNKIAPMPVPSYREKPFFQCSIRTVDQKTVKKLVRIHVKASN